MKNSIFVPILLSFGIVHLVDSAIVIARQSEENILSPIIDPIDDFVGGAVSTGVGATVGAVGVVGGAIGDAVNQLVKESRGDTQSSPEADQFKPDDTSQIQTEPDVKLRVTNSEECDRNSESTDCQGDRYMIYPEKCAATQNAQVTNKLKGWKANFWISKRIRVLKSMEGVVAEVVRDGIVKSSGVARYREPTKGKRSTTSLKRRDPGDSVLIQSNAPAHLAFVSSKVPPSQKFHDYCYFSNAGRNVMLYVVESGIDALHDDFAANQVVTKILRAPEANDVGTTFDEHGTCVVSVAAGAQCGAAKELKATVAIVSTYEIVENGETVHATYASGSLNAYQRIENDLYARERNGETVRGHTIMTITQTFLPFDTFTHVRHQNQWTILIEQYQVVITVSAGNTNQPGQLIDELPQLYAPEMPLINVGGIDLTTGNLHVASKDSSPMYMTILAPFRVTCAAAGRAYWPRDGTSFSAPLAAGVIAGWMSGPWGDRAREDMRRQPGFTMAAAAKAYIQSKGRPVRGSRHKALWNGLDNAQGPPLYGWTLD